MSLNVLFLFISYQFFLIDQTSQGYSLTLKKEIVDIKIIFRESFITIPVLTLFLPTFIGGRVHVVHGKSLIYTLNVYIKIKFAICPLSQTVARNFLSQWMLPSCIKFPKKALGVRESSPFLHPSSTQLSSVVRFTGSIYLSCTFIFLCLPSYYISPGAHHLSRPCQIISLL